MKFEVKSDMRFSHPVVGVSQSFRILEKGTIIDGLAPAQMTVEEKEWLNGLKKRDPHNKRRIGFRWLDKFRTAIIGDELSPYRAGGVISKRNW